MQGKIPRLVLTGGPCAGKSTGLAILAQKLPDYGIRPFFVPEIATLLITNGVKIGEIMADPKLVVDFERQLLRAQLAFEEIWEVFASIHPGDRKVLICDRGAMDVAAYLDRGVFSAMIGDLGLSIFDLRDRRYRAVFHLVTAACGAEEFYNLDNPARYEDPAQARETDQKTIAAWNGHEHWRIIDNVEGSRQISFDEKMSELLRAVCQALGVPMPIEIERKFLIDPATDPNTFPVPVSAVDIRQTYLVTNGEGERRVRERREVGPVLSAHGVLHTYTEKKEIRPGVRHEAERIISATEYLGLLAERDHNKSEVIKRRYSFPWEGQYFELDVISSPIKLVVLEAELTDEQTYLVFPPFITKVKEVTDDERYSNSRIAAGLCPGY